MSDYIMTIDSDAETSTFKNDPIDDVKLDPDFVFDLAGDPYSEIINKSLGIEDFIKTGSKPVRSSLFWLVS
jgi:ATP-dependent RNA helicase DDX27